MRLALPDNRQNQMRQKIICRSRQGGGWFSGGWKNGVGRQQLVETDRGREKKHRWCQVGIGVGGNRDRGCKVISGDKRVCRC